MYALITSRIYFSSFVISPIPAKTVYVNKVKAIIHERKERARKQAEQQARRDAARKQSEVRKKIHLNENLCNLSGRKKSFCCA